MKESYLPLYRKYRPQILEDVVGQSHIKSALTNAIKLDKIAHAYLFTGPRGTGKTSTARILAKSLNCVNGPTISPCGECESCKAVTNSVPVDVIEIDAASNRSVEDAHNILEKVQYAPVHGKYKIYIIDEVHMLSTQAFNALLKTLEEPPKNVVFILATTESHKVLDTIKSRCQRFDFKRITTNDIVEHLVKIAKLEKINISKEGILTIAKISAGGMRDSLALLDQVSALSAEKELTEVDVNNLLGRLSFDTLTEMANSIVNSDAITAINILDKIYNDGNEPIVILNNALLYFKNLLISITCDLEKSVELTSLNDTQVKVLAEYKNKIETHQVVSIINKISEYIKEIKQTNHQQMWLEVALIDLANLTNNTKLEDLQRRLSALECGAPVPQQRQVVTPVVNVKQTEVQQQVVQTEPVVKVEQSSPQVSDNQTKVDESTVQDISDVSAVWQQVLNNILDLPQRIFLQKNAVPVEITDKKITLVMQKSNWADTFNNSEKKQIVVDAAALVLINPKIQIVARTPLKDESQVPTPPKEVQKKNVTKPENIESSDVDHEIETATEALNENNQSIDIHSDQSEMIKQLFDGKYIV